jgi:hypothetical protein
MEVLFEAETEYAFDFLIFDVFDFATHEVVGHFGVGEVAIGGLSEEHLVEDDAD